MPRTRSDARLSMENTTHIRHHGNGPGPGHMKGIVRHNNPLGYTAAHYRETAIDKTHIDRYIFVANPLAMILSAALIFKYGFDRMEEGTLIRRAVNDSINAGIVTEDLADGGKAFCFTRCLMCCAAA